MKKIYVFCPPYIKTGGTELAHQLVQLLNENGKNANIAYLEDKDNKYINPAFLQYVDNYVLIKDIDDIEENLVVIPEGMTEYVKCYNKAQQYIWWMSVDNYYKPVGLKMAYDNNGMNQVIKELVKRVIRRNEPCCTPISEMNSVKLHLVQSKYAENFLRRNGINNIMYLSDYINDKYIELSKVVNITSKENFVLYNPKKGRRFTQKLINECKEIRFIPIENMSNEQVIEIMSRAKVYIDFGNHPGKDRMPREAALMHCCIITGKRGSANFFEDVSISDEFKFDDSADNYKSIESKIVDIFNNFSGYDLLFDKYREKITNEKEQFEKQTREIFL